VALVLVIVILLTFAFGVYNTYFKHVKNKDKTQKKKPLRMWARPK
jgi:hypothetical protein